MITLVGFGQARCGLVGHGRVWRIFHGHKSVTPNRGVARQGSVRRGLVGSGGVWFGVEVNHSENI
jgi:hypothetical protein